MAATICPCSRSVPFWMLEYVSKHNKRKDYEDNMQKYEHKLKVPYYLLFIRMLGKLTVFHLRRANLSQREAE